MDDDGDKPGSARWNVAGLQPGGPSGNGLPINCVMNGCVLTPLRICMYSNDGRFRPERWLDDDLALAPPRPTSTMRKAPWSKTHCSFRSPVLISRTPMWVLDLGTCTIHMDDKALRFPSPTLPKREPSDREQNDDDDASAADDRPKKRTRRVVDSSTTCAPEQLHCRYANKKCLNPRAIKRTGGLHTFCAMHRANANRNQRRLDMRKRMARQALRAQAEAGDGGQVQVPVALKTEAVVTTASTTGGHAQYEPLQTPTPLQAEDISTLVTLFLPPLTPQTQADGSFGFQLDAPITPTTPRDWSPSTSTGGNTPTPPPPPPPSGGMRF
ncbi:hypothetical protein PR003_g25855 [Phytophthora rubi]|uniref:Uncharacterized protein n=1 Tax=Phytophthora rubi TaxID=129364 RepID=A0A6A4CKK4_9STRA|nr:hypothetical protein PR003_g25855 [Phytophthora rubi]